MPVADGAAPGTRHPADGGAPAVRHFTLRTARSPALAIGLTLAIAVEALALHLLLASRHPGWAWASTILSVSGAAWLLADDRAFRGASVTVTREMLTLALGRRWNAALARDELASAAPVTCDAQPEPNVLLTWRAPVALRGPGGIRIQAQRLGLRVDDPAGFVAALASPSEPAGRAAPFP
jgi:hypothetical protein